jgi:hypothetical protein
MLLLKVKPIDERNETKLATFILIVGDAFGWLIGNCPCGHEMWTVLVQCHLTDCCMLV